MSTGLGWSRDRGMWIPALGKLFHTGHIDAAIVQIVLDVGQVFHQETSVGADRVSTEGD